MRPRATIAAAQPLFSLVVPCVFQPQCVLVYCRMALSVQVYLKIDRVDQAEKQLKVGINRKAVSLLVSLLFMVSVT